MSTRKACLVCLVCLSHYVIVSKTTREFCGYQRCREGYTFCINRRCKSCSDLDGTGLGCHNTSTWKHCYLHCKDQFEQKLEAGEKNQNKTCQKQLDEMNRINDSSQTVTYLLRNNDKHYYLNIGITTCAILLVLSCGIVIICRRYHSYVRRKEQMRCGDQEDQRKYNDKGQDVHIPFLVKTETETKSTQTENFRDTTYHQSCCLREHNLLTGVPVQNSCNE